jgi:homoserine O-acetyltransferase
MDAADEHNQSQNEGSGMTSVVETGSTEHQSRFSADIQHELVGPPDAPVLLVLGGISASRHITSNGRDRSPGWWEETAGEGRALDTRVYRLLGVEYLDGGRRRDGRPATRVSTHDQAAAIVALLDELEIPRVAAIGASYGGMVALALAERWPERLERLVVIGAAHESHAMATALRAIQRRIVELGLDGGRSFDGVALARALAMTTYRTAAEFDTRFGSEPRLEDGAAEFDVERYLLRAGEKFARQMSAERFLALSLSADLHRVVPERIDVRTTIVASEGDTLVPVEQLSAMAQRLPRLDGLVTLRSLTGHDAFLTEPAQVGRILTTALAD